MNDDTTTNEDEPDEAIPAEIVADEPETTTDDERIEQAGFCADEGRCDIDVLAE
jgi:hypothetical protein